MDNRESTHVVGSYVTPLAISLAGIICSTLALAAYHFILVRCCHRPQQMQQQSRNNNNNRNHNKSGCGVQEEILNKIPVISYSINTSNAFGFDQSECSICLGELEEGDLVRLLPACNHAFHIPCIDAWFIEHASCPFCRSSIICECESMVPTASENAGQQRVSHENPSDHDHHQLMDDEVSGSTSTSSRFPQPLNPVLLRHSLSISSHMQKKPRVSGMRLKRSLSMDQSSSYIAITIQRDQEIMASTSAGSTKWVVMSQYNFKSRSLRHLDHMSSVLRRSFSQLRNSRSGRSNGILPN